MLTKICGVTRPGDAAIAARLGADFIGVVFFERSRRCVTVEQAIEIGLAAGASSDHVRVVGVFVDASPEVVRSTVAAARLDAVQLHGAIEGVFDVPVIRAIAADHSMATPPADFLLVDNASGAERGGSGRTFEWSALDRTKLRRPYFVAGGLHAGNVALAIATLSPDGVDVASGVEDDPGVKNNAKLHAFFDAVRAVEESR